MKRHLLFAVIVIFAIGCARASSPLLIDITTIDGKAVYTLNSAPKTPDELGLWFVETVKLFGPNVATIVIRPDNQTKFTTVLDIALRLKKAGVTHIEISCDLPDAKKDEWGHVNLALNAISREELANPLYRHP